MIVWIIIVSLIVFLLFSMLFIYEVGIANKLWFTLHEYNLYNAIEKIEKQKNIWVTDREIIEKTREILEFLKD